MRVMVIAAHPGDEVFGCGGTMARHTDCGNEVTTLFVADGETQRTIDALPNLNFKALDASKALACRAPRFLDYTMGRLDVVPMADIVKYIGSAMDIIDPAIVYTHHDSVDDIDQRIVNHAVRIATPIDRSIFMFESMSNPRFVPDHFVNITFNIDPKVAAATCYGSDLVDRVTPLARHRGSQSGNFFAEAFITFRSVR